MISKEYARLIGECPTLTREEELKAWLDGNFDLLARSQLPYVIKLAASVCRRYRFKDVDMAISAGNIALIESLRRFDPRKARLTTWVTRVVLWRVAKEIQIDRQGCGPSERIMASRRVFLVPLDAIVRNSVPHSFDPESDLDNELNRLRAAIKRLKPRLARVIRARLDGLTLREIGDKMGISRERVRQLERVAIHAIKKDLSKPASGREAAVGAKASQVDGQTNQGCAAGGSQRPCSHAGTTAAIA